MTCPYCSFQNEDGTLFCERCKSDLFSIPERNAMSETANPVEAMPATSETLPAQDMPAHDIPMAEPIASQDHALGEAEASANGAPASVSTDEYQPMAEGTASAEAAPPKLLVVRGQKVNVEYTLYPGENFLGRTDEKPVDIDLEDQEAADRVWCSRQHARIMLDENGMTIEDLGSQNGTFVNRARIYPGQLRPLAPGDVVQVGTVQLKVKAE
jgi:hypothetical protein